LAHFEGFWVPSVSKYGNLCTDALSGYLVTTRKCVSGSQSNAGEPSGFARRHCFESMAIVFAIDVACILISVLQSYLPKAGFL
jgi:hypothetical protein